jgi:outer membrane protein assembly factor BamB
MKSLAAAVLLALGPSPQEEGDERTAVRLEHEGEILRKWEAAEEEKDWRARLELFAVAQRRYRDQLVRPEPEVSRWLRLPEVLARRLLEAPENVREPSEILARQLIEAAEDRGARAEAVERYAFTRAALQAREALANEDFDRGRVREAVRGWSLALDVRYSPELVARLAHAHALLGDAPALGALRARARSEEWKGDLAVAGRRVELAGYLDALKAAEAPAPAPLFKAAALPTNEIALGRFEFRGSNEGGVYARGQAAALAAAGRFGEKELVFLTNGLRLTAIDPARAEGGPLEEAVEWRYPKDGTVRYSMPTHVVSSGQPSPMAGATVAGDRVYAVMFTAGSQADKQQLPERRRYNARFEGPGALRAFDAASGQLLWDTEKLEIEVEQAAEVEIDGRKVKTTVQERRTALDYALGAPANGSYNFCFAGPPLVRGDRLYAAVMTSPMVGRECWAVCLDAGSGLPIWCTAIGRAPAKREICSVASIEEEDGTLVVLSNFGIAAALESATGRVDWLVKYPLSVGFGRRTASPPVLLGSVVLLLPQDSAALLAYDRWTGREAPLPDLGEVSWPGVAQLLGKAGDWVVLTGPKSFAVRPWDGKVLCLLELEPARSGRGALAGGLLYLPGKGALHVYDARDWKPVADVPWPDGEEAGNLLVTDTLLGWMGDRFDLFTGRAALGERFAGKLKAGHAPSCRQLGRILESSGRLQESLLYYRKALAVWEKDPAWTETAEGLRKKLGELQERIDAESEKK